MLSLNYNDIEEELDPKYLDRGKNYWRQKRVVKLEIEQAGSMITALVNGNRKRPYLVRIELEIDDGETAISGLCTCPIGYNCKHVAASLFAALEKTKTPLSNQLSLWPIPEQQNSELKQWFGALDLFENPPPPEIEPDVPQHEQHLLYILYAGESVKKTEFNVKLQSARLLKSGGYSKSYRFYLTSMDELYQQPIKFLKKQDIDILSQFLIQKVSSSLNPYRLQGSKSLDLLRAMVATGRCHWQDKDTPALTLGKTRKAILTWRIDGHGLQRPVLTTSPKSILSTSTPFYYLDSEHHRCGPIRMDYDEALITTILKAPPIPPAQVCKVSERLQSTDANLPLPAELSYKDLGQIKPVPFLQLKQVDIKRTYLHWYQIDDPSIPIVVLQYHYQGQLFHPNNARKTIDIYNKKEDNITRFSRDITAEKQLCQQLTDFGLNYFAEPDLIEQTPPGLVYHFDIDTNRNRAQSQWISFILDAVPALVDEGWKIETADDFSYQMAEIDDWYVDIEDKPDNRWFDLELGIRVDGQTQNLLPLIVSWLQNSPKQIDAGYFDQLPDDHKLVIPLEDGRLLPVPTSRIKGIINILVELFDKNSLGKTNKLRISQWQAADLMHLQAAMDASQTRWFGSKRLQKLGQKLQSFSGMSNVKPPPNFKASLRPYQQEGLNWLQFLREYELGGILADDMGLGKTVQTLAHLAIEKTKKRLKLPTLVVAPTSLMFNWQQEAARFVPNLKVLCLHGPNRKALYKEIHNYDLLLTTYALLIRDDIELLELEFYYLILDEAQFIKNSKSKTKSVVQQINAKHRLCLTGTPMENHLGELWSLFDFLMPGLLAEEKNFRRLFRTPIEKHGNLERQTRLNQRIKPFLLRRKKDVVAKELPPKTEIIRVASLSSGQQDLYETIRLAMHDKVRKVIRSKGLNRSHIEILEALLKLRQVCCDPRLVKMASARKAKNSAKLELLMELLPSLLEEGRKVLLFSQFTSMLKLIEQELHNKNIDYVKLTGQTINRGEIIKTFTDGKIPLFLISLKAGGTGLNLMAADTVIHYDPWWNPAVENQATDRAHRIGQDKPVFVYKLLTEGTVEQRIAVMQARKQALADGVLHNKNKLTSGFNQQDLEDLFAPLT